MLVPKPVAVLVLLLSLLSFRAVADAGPNFPVCLQNVLNSGSFEGTVDTNGNPTTNITQITGITYDRCVADCGSGPVDFDWYTFSQQFTSWLLPWLALISQLPYGTRDALSNFVAVILIVGSPTLAAYSLTLAIISNRWMIKRFERNAYHNTRLAVKVLSKLQQVPLELPREEYVLPSLIVLPENRIWWKTLDRGLDTPAEKWTLEATMSVLSVALVGIFMWMAILADPNLDVAVNEVGETIASPWLCFLPILIGNLQLSPQSNWNRIRKAFDEANSSFYLATDDGVPEQGRGSLFIRTASWDAVDEDELCSAPLFFYARAFTWIRVALKVASGLDAASQHARDPRTNGIPPSKRQQVIEYCKSEDQATDHTYEIYSIFLTSAFLAIFLQWGTTGAATMAMFLTPTKGLGCHSGAYLLYGIVSTVVWLLCVLSCFLAHSYKSSKKRTATSQFVWAMSIACRLIAKTLAACNVVLLILAAIFQFSNLSNNCYCNSSKLSLHSKAYYVMIFPSNSIKVPWGAGLFVSFLTAALFLFIINLLREPRAPMDKSPSEPPPDCLEITELSKTSSRRSAATMTEAVEENGCSRCRVASTAEKHD